MVGFGDKKELCTWFKEIYPNRAAITQSCISQSAWKKSSTNEDNAWNVLRTVRKTFKVRGELYRDFKISHPYKVRLVQELSKD